MMVWQPAVSKYEMTALLTVSILAMMLVDSHAYMLFTVALLIIILLAVAGAMQGVCIAYAATVVVFVSFARGTLISEAFDVLLVIIALTSYSFLRPSTAEHKHMTVAVSSEKNVALSGVLRLALLFIIMLTAVMLANLLSWLLGIRVTNILILLPMLGFGFLIIVMAGRLAIRAG